MEKHKKYKFGDLKLSIQMDIILKFFDENRDPRRDVILHFGNGRSEKFESTVIADIIKSDMAKEYTFNNGEKFFPYLIRNFDSYFGHCVFNKYGKLL